MKKKASLFQDSKACMAFLAARYRIPKSMLDEIRAIMIQDALIDGQTVAYNRIYTAVALMLHEHLGYGRKRIVSALHAFDNIVGRVLDSDTNWEDIMKELDDKTGLIIRMEDDKVLCEYQTPEEIQEGKLL